MKSDVNHKVKRPRWIWALTEGGRALFELGTYLPYKFLRKKDYEADGHPVLILPGFLASDNSTIILRKFIHELGFKVYGWGQGRNYASEEYLRTLSQKLDNIYKTHGEAVSIIGWSLGGIYARQLGKMYPKKVRQIITMGSPFKGIRHANNAKWLYDLFIAGQEKIEINEELLEDIPNPAPLPTTAIYSKEDGVVPWKYCMEEIETELHQNIQVRGSHLGLGVNPSVLEIIADRLQYDEENWQQFTPSNILEDLILYPSLKTA